MADSLFFTKLKERKVLQWTVAYIAAAWVVAQVIETAAGPWNLPATWIRLLHVALVAGAPLAIILAWFHGARGEQRIRGIEIAALAAVLLVAGIVAAALGSLASRDARPEATFPGGSPGAIAGTVPRLAVLAFSNLGAAEDDYFADGLTAELNSRLSGLKNLAVLSRSSGNRYRDATKSPSEIGRALGADYVLSGTVRWQEYDGGTSAVRVLPEMIRTEDDTQIWSSQYDRSFDDALNLQAEIALQVAHELGLAISDREVATMTAPPTRNPLAFDAYLRGIEVLPTGHGSEADLRQARLLLQQAVTLDPDFALAWTKLADADIGLYWFGYDAQQSRLATALASIEKAEASDPGLPEAAIMRGDYHYRQRDYDAALATYGGLLEKRPNDSQILRNVGMIWRRQGLFEPAVVNLEQAMLLDPLSAYEKLEVAWTHLFMGNYDRALALVREAKATDPTEEWSYVIGTVSHWSRGAEGDLEAARRELDSFPDPRSNYPAWFDIMQNFFEGNAEGALTRIRRLPDPVFVFQHTWEPVELLRARTYRMLGREDAAKREFANAAAILEAAAIDNPDDFRLPLSLGKAYAGLGRTEEALREAGRGVELMSVARDALLGTDALYHALEIYAMLADRERVLDTAAQLLSVPSTYRGLYFTRNPVLAAYQDDREYRALLE